MMTKWIASLSAAGVLASACGEIKGNEDDTGPAPDAAPVIDGNAGVDEEPPETTLTAVPDDPTGAVSFDFAFEANEPATFQCRVDDAEFAECSSPHPVTVAEGSHTFEVYAVDESDNADESPASRTWTVDTTAPDTSIDSGPGGAVSSTTASFSLSSDEAGVSYECALDGGAFAACDAAPELTGLSEGEHTLQARARDGAGNVDGSPASWSWTVDTTAPTVTISSTPTDPSGSAAAQLIFDADESPVTYQCSLVLQGSSPSWQGCSSPKSYTGMSDGHYTFSVRATDAAGNVGMAATYDWTVDTTAPVAEIASAPGGPTNASSLSFEFTANETDVTYECSLVPSGSSASWSACSSPETYSGVTTDTYTFSVRATDLAGNTGTADTHTVEVDQDPPSVTITDGPSGTTGDTSATFTYSTEAGATLQCSIDSTTAFTGCDSSTTHTVSGLGHGSHTFRVRATDDVGNTGDPDSRTWSVDIEPPTTTLTGFPDEPWPVDYATFAFDADDADADFECRLDGGSWMGCSSPREVTDLSYGNEHTFEVRATDAYGNVETSPQSFTWLVERGLVLSFRFDGNAQNYSPLGSTHDGSVDSGVSWVGGFVGEAAKFGGNSVVSIPDTTKPMTTSHEYTIAVWYRDPVDDAAGFLLRFMSESGSGCSLFDFNSADYDLLACCAYQGETECNNDLYFGQQDWRHVALQYQGTSQSDGGPVGVYANGSKVGTIDNPNNGNFFGEDQLGKMLVGESWDAVVDELRVYNRTFSEAELCEQVIGGMWWSANMYCELP